MIRHFLLPRITNYYDVGGDVMLVLLLRVSGSLLLTPKRLAAMSRCLQVAGKQDTHQVKRQTEGERMAEF